MRLALDVCTACVVAPRLPLGDVCARSMREDAAALHILNHILPPHEPNIISHSHDIDDDCMSMSKGVKASAEDRLVDKTHLRVVPIRAPAIVVYTTVLHWITIQMIVRQRRVQAIRSRVDEATICPVITSHRQHRTKRSQPTVACCLQQLHGVADVVVRHSDIATI